MNQERLDESPSFTEEHADHANHGNPEDSTTAPHRPTLTELLGSADRPVAIPTIAALLVFAVGALLTWQTREAIKAERETTFAESMADIDAVLSRAAASPRARRTRPRRWTAQARRSSRTPPT